MAESTKWWNYGNE